MKRFASAYASSIFPKKLAMVRDKEVIDLIR